MNTIYETKGLKSTKKMEFCNSRTATRSYKTAAVTATACSVAIKVGGREKSRVSFAVRDGKLVQTFPMGANAVNPVDLAEVTAIAKRALKLN